MATLYLKRTLSGFIAADEPSAELARKYKVGEIYKSVITKPRSYQHHKLIFSLLALTFKNQERYSNFNDFRKAVTIAAGQTHEIVLIDGEIIREALSLSFDNLDEVEFTKVAGAMMTVCAHLLHDMDIDDLAAEVAIYADQNYGEAAA
jgi:hypothetical protein